MEVQGITTRLLSVPPPGVAGLSRADSIAVARDANDELAALSQSTGGRLRGLAVLPLQHPDAAADELVRAAGIGLAGAQLLSNAEGRPLDGPEYHVLFAAAAENDVTLVIHPTLPIDRTAVDAAGLMTTLGFLFDTTACVARLVISGIYDRHPDLKLLLPHVGSTIPLLLGRFDHQSIGAASTSTVSAFRPRHSDWLSRPSALIASCSVAMNPSGRQSEQCRLSMPRN